MTPSFSPLRQEQQNPLERGAFINGEDRTYDAVIYTPVLNSGISIDAGHGYEIVAYLCATSSTPVDSLQLLHRFREVQNIHVAIDERRETHPTDPAQLKEQLLGALAYDSDALTTDLDDHLRIRHPDFEAVHTENLAHEYRQRRDYAGMVLALLEETGRNVITQPVTLDKHTAEAHDQARDEIRAEHYDAVAHAPTLTPHEAEMRREQELNYEGECALERYDLLEFFGLEPDATHVDTVRALAEADRGGELRAQVRLLITTRADDARIQVLRQREAINLEDQRWGTGAPEIMRTPFALQRELYQRILGAANIDLDTLEQSEPYTTSSVLQQLEAIARDRKRYGTLVNIPRLSALRKNPNQWLGQQLRACGLRTRRERPRGSAPRYHLEPESGNRMMSYLEMAEGALEGERWTPAILYMKNRWVWRSMTALQHSKTFRCRSPFRTRPKRSRNTPLEPPHSLPKVPPHRPTHPGSKPSKRFTSRESLTRQLGSTSKR